MHVGGYLETQLIVGGFEYFFNEKKTWNLERKKYNNVCMCLFVLCGEGKSFFC